MEGWIKLHRKFSDWEWFQDSYMVHLFIYLLLNANHKEGKWKGVDIERGSLITGRKKLSLATGISEQIIRTRLKKLEQTNEIKIASKSTKESTKESTNKSTNSCTIITICNYDNYQSEIPTPNQEFNQEPNQEPNHELTSNQPATNQELTTNKNDKKKKNEKKRESTLANFSEEEIKIYNKFLSWSKENIPNVCKMQKPLSIDEYFKIKNSFPAQFIITLLYKMDNYKNINKKNVSTYRTFLNWAEKE